MTWEIIKNKARKFLDNDNAFSDYILWWLIFKIGFTVAVVLVIFVIVQSGHGNVDYGSRELDGKIIANALYNSKLFMEYDEKIDRLYPGRINSTKWDDLATFEKEINEQLSTGDVKYIAMCVRLNAENNERVVCYDRDTYNKWATYFNGDFKQGSGAYVYSPTEYLVDVNGKSGKLSFDILIPRG
ncbi:hypothetical protein H6503_01785 [Candidatus Woesearchaeota archaeon]|nr:hypothetical protein [Candidatus Woesearchaeota archaeon]